jgi:hypothetical protein
MAGDPSLSPVAAAFDFWYSVHPELEVVLPRKKNTTAYVNLIEQAAKRAAVSKVHQGQDLTDPHEFDPGRKVSTTGGPQISVSICDTIMSHMV